MPWTTGLAVRVFTHELATVGRRRVVDALVGLAQEQGLAGVTVTRALAEAPVADGKGAPVTVEMIDRAERIEVVLPQIAALAPHGAVSVTETRVYLPASRLRAADAHEESAQTLAADASAADALHALLNRGVRLLPVLDAAGKPVGVITLNHILRQIEGDLAARLLDLSQPEQLRARLLAQLEGKRASDLMRAPALTVADDTPLDDVARYLTSRHITRAPTTDAHGRYAGLVGEHTLARLMTRPLLVSEVDATQSADAHGAQQEALAMLAGSVEPTSGEPLTAGMLADTDIPVLAQGATWGEVTSAVERGGVALVVDGQRRLCGVIEEGALLERATGDERPGGLATLRRLLAQATGQREALKLEQVGAQRAGDLCQPARLTTQADAPLASALASMVVEGGVDYAVILGSDEQPTGVLWRQDALRALVGR